MKEIQFSILMPIPMMELASVMVDVIVMVVPKEGG